MPDSFFCWEISHCQNCLSKACLLIELNMHTQWYMFIGWSKEKSAKQARYLCPALVKMDLLLLNIYHSEMSEVLFGEAMESPSDTRMKEQLFNSIAHTALTSPLPTR